MPLRPGPDARGVGRRAPGRGFPGEIIRRPPNSWAPAGSWTCAAVPAIAFQRV